MWWWCSERRKLWSDYSVGLAGRFNTLPSVFGKSVFLCIDLLETSSHPWLAERTFLSLLVMVSSLQPLRHLLLRKK